MDRAIIDVPGDYLTKLACMDFMVELGWIVEIPQDNVPHQQARIFKRGSM